jgi:hypothetical protein
MKAPPLPLKIDSLLSYTGTGVDAKGMIFDP